MTAPLHDISLTLNDGRNTTLADLRGKVLLVVNVASRCGLTPQYEGLEKLYRSRRNEGLEVLAFPANDFNGQEPGSDEEIRDFCSTNYDVSFPLFSKIKVAGTDKHPLYAELIDAQPQATGDGPFRERLKGFGLEPNPVPEVLWNFEKFLIGRDGRVIGRFAPNLAADDPEITGAIDQALAESAD